MKNNERKIEWNSQHITSDEQEMEYKMRFLNFTSQKKWDILMAMCNTRFTENIKKTKRRIVWNANE